MAWIAMPNENETKSLVHSDLCDYYLAHHGIKVQKFGVIRSRNKASYALTNRGAKVATKMPSTLDHLLKKSIKERIRNNGYY